MRGELVTAAAGAGYVGKPRPAVIVQADSFETAASVIVCSLTTNPLEVHSMRVTIAPSSTNGLRSRSWAMIDKLSVVQRAKIGKHIGRLASEDMVRLNRALIAFLGLDR